MTGHPLDMTLDRDLRELFAAGPLVAPKSTLERGLVRAEAVSQRHARFARLDRRTWPPEHRSASDPSVHRLARLALAGLLILVAGAVLVVGSQIVDRTPAPTTPAPTPPTPTTPSATLTLSIVPAGTVELRSADQFRLRLWPDGRLLVGHEYLFDLAAGTTERLAAELAPDASPSVYPISDGRVVLVYDKNLDGSVRRGRHTVAILDPASGVVTEVGRLQTYASQQAELVLRDGRIVVSGGTLTDETGADMVLDTAYVFDVDSGTTTQLQPMQQPRLAHRMVELIDGRVLVMGGDDPDLDEVGRSYPEFEMYDLETGTTIPVGETLTEPVYSLQGGLVAQLGDGRVVISGRPDFLEPCGPLPQPPGGLIGGPSIHVVSRHQTQVFDPATATLRDGPLIPTPNFDLVPLGGNWVLLSNQGRAFASCAVDATPVLYPWLGLADFGSGTVFDSPNPLTGEGTLDVLPEAVYSAGVRLPDGRVALIEAPGDDPEIRRIDVLTVAP